MGYEKNVAIVSAGSYVSAVEYLRDEKVRQANEE